MTEVVPVRLMCADDHPLIRKGIAAITATEPGLTFAAEASNGKEAIEVFRQCQPDVTLMDLRLPLLSGIDAIRAIVREFPDARIIALTMYAGDEDIRRAFDSGAVGYLLKEQIHTEVLTAISAVHATEKYIPKGIAARLNEPRWSQELTPREVEVLAKVAGGLYNRQVARLLGITEGTVKIHVQNILSKLNARDRTEAVTKALSLGIIHLE